MKYPSQATFMAFEGRAWAWCRGFVLGWGFAWSSLAQADPPLLVCPGPLFTNELSPAEAKTRGCALAARGRLSQAQDMASQAIAEHAPPPSSTATSQGTTATPLGTPAASAFGKIPEASADTQRQRQRDSHAREIVLTELARTQARIKAMAAQQPSGPEAESALQRLQRDEDALRRELARRPS